MSSAAASVSNRALLFGFGMIAVVVAGVLIAFPPFAQWTNGHFGLLMLALIVVAIMLGFPTAFTLMGMGFLFTWFAFERDTTKTLDLMVQRAFGVMTNDVLISIPLFVFMGYLVERSNLIDRLFRSLHVAMTGVPGALAVATLVTCAVFATATGIVGAVVTLMGLLALPAMLKAGYDEKLATGVIAAGGCLGILLPPSVMLIVYGATASVSVVQLYAGALFPGLMLTGLYLLYVIALARFRPQLAPPLTEEQRKVTLTPTELSFSQRSPNALKSILTPDAWRTETTDRGSALRYALVVLTPALAVSLVLAMLLGAPQVVEAPAAPIPVQQASQSTSFEQGLVGGAKRLGDNDEASSFDTVQAAPASTEATASTETAASSAVASDTTRLPWQWMVVAGAVLALVVYYRLLNHRRAEIFRQLLGSFFPLVFLILAVMGSIVVGLTTATEAAAIGALGGFVLAVAYRQLSWQTMKESVFLTVKTSSMVCWLFVGSAMFSAAFALLGGQELVEKWVLSLDLTTTQFLILSQIVIFLLGWPLEWTEIIVIFMPIFLPLLKTFNVDPLYFGLLVALNLQAAFLSPPVAMAAFYLKGVAPPHVTLQSIFIGMMPFMGLQIVALVILYLFPGIGMWLPTLLYR